MVAIATRAELASLLQIDVAGINTATADLLLAQAQGLITEKIGDQDPWPTTAKTVALAAAGRAYRNPEAVKREAAGAMSRELPDEEMGVYLTGTEEKRLEKWLNRSRGSVGTIRTESGYPPVVDDCELLRWRS